MESRFEKLTSVKEEEEEEEEEEQEEEEEEEEGATGEGRAGESC